MSCQTCSFQSVMYINVSIHGDVHSERAVGATFGPLDPSHTGWFPKWRRPILWDEEQALCLSISSQLARSMDVLVPNVNLSSLVPCAYF